MKSLALCTFTLLAAAAGLAHADEREDKINQLKNELSEFGSALQAVEKKHSLDGASYFSRPVADCTALVAQLKELGLAPTETISGIPFRKAAQLCESYGKWRALAPAFAKIKEAESDASHLVGAKPGQEGFTRFAGFAVDSGAACVKAIDEAVANGASLDTVLFNNHMNEVSKTVAEHRAQCDAQVTTAKELMGASAGADAALEKKARERYTKFGAGGDKLAWLLKYDGDGKGAYWSIAPRCDRTDDPKTLAKSKVLMNWYDNPDRTVTILKLTFKGNKLVKEQTKSFDTKAAAYRFCK